MHERDFLSEQFEEHRPHLRTVAYRMLGSLTEADDAVQDSWLRVSRSATSDIENMRGWLTTVVSRVCLNMLRSRASRREEPMTVHVPDPIVTSADAEHEMVLADSVGLALLVVLETLAPAERLAFVLHDMFGMSFDDIAPVVGRTPTATRQLASRARRRVRGAAPDRAAVDRRGQREVVEAFLAAARRGDFEALLAVLDPDVIHRSDRGIANIGASAITRGAQAVARNATMFAQMAKSVQHVLVNGDAGFVAFTGDGEPMSLLSFTIEGGRIIEINAIVDPVRLRRLLGDGMRG
ncbi:MAG: RNA polymerase sigma factor SigJ [bacterium]